MKDLISFGYNPEQRHKNMKLLRAVCLYILLFSVSYCRSTKPKITTQTVIESTEVQQALGSKNLKAILMNRHKDDSSLTDESLFVAASDSCVAFVIGSIIKDISNEIPINMRNKQQSGNAVTNGLTRMIWPPKPEQIKSAKPSMATTWQIIISVRDRMCYGLVPGVSDGEEHIENHGAFGEEEGVVVIELDTNEFEDGE